MLELSLKKWLYKEFIVYVEGKIGRKRREHTGRYLGDLLGSLQGGWGVGMCILPLIYLFICTAHLNKRASREATSA